MAKKASSVLKFTLSLLLAAALLWFAFRGLEWREFTDGLKATRWGWIAASLAAGLAALVMRAERWRLQLRTLSPGIGRLMIWDASNIGNFLNIVIPGSGEFVRCAEVSTATKRYDSTFGTILFERAWDILAILLLLVIAVISNGDVLGPFVKEHVIEPLTAAMSCSIWIFLAGILAAFFAGIVLIWRKRHSSVFCRKCAEAIKGIVGGIRSFGSIDGKWRFLVHTVGIWTLYIIVTWATFLAIPGLEGLSFYDALFISAIGNIASVIPTPGNLGAYHYLVGLSISTIYLGAAEITSSALLCATLSHGSHALLIIILAVVSYISRAYQSKKTNL